MHLAQLWSGKMRGQSTHVDRLRMKVVVPIGVIVAVAIVCIVVAVLSAAQRADDVALEQERRLFTEAIIDYSDRVLREVESVATTEKAVRTIRANSDRNWIERHIGGWLKEFFGHDHVFIVDSSDRFIYGFGAGIANPDSAYNGIQRDLTPAIDYLRGRGTGKLDSQMAMEPARAIYNGPASRVALVQSFMGRPAVVAAVLVIPPDNAVSSLDTSSAPIVLSVKFIDDDVLAEIGPRLQLRNLRGTTGGLLGVNDYVFELGDANDHSIARFAWTPKRPGAEIVRSVVPFIAVALGGFALLAGLIFRYMRRTAATIAAGEIRLRHLALHDPLCGLPNRMFFSERLEQMIGDVASGRPAAAVFYIDLDHFKDVNDTLGHSIGDELLRNVTLRLTGAIRGDDIVARLGGDEFAVITAIGADGSTPQMIAERLISVLCTPYAIGSHTLVIGASVGIAMIDSRAGDAADVMRYADMALYRAKNEGRNRACTYDEVMDADLSQRKLIEHDLREAIAGDDLRVAYQPVVNAAGTKLIGVEALARWNHPTRGAISPAEFIPIAEHSGLIIELGEWVLRRACLDGKAWPGLFIAVNVSPLQFRQLDFIDTVERILSDTDFDPKRLELELTESTLLGNVDAAEAAMRGLRALGVRLALDDFGTGYSSLQYLRRFPFDKLKIDRTFVLSVENAEAAAIVHAVVSLGRGLGMKVTAEGVESAEQHLFLRAAGVHSMQGYRFGRPQTASDITDRLASPSAFHFDTDVAAMAS